MLKLVPQRQRERKKRYVRHKLTEKGFTLVSQKQALHLRVTPRQYKRTSQNNYCKCTNTRSVEFVLAKPAHRKKDKTRPKYVETFCYCRMRARYAWSRRLTNGRHDARNASGVASAVETLAASNASDSHPTGCHAVTRRRRCRCVIPTERGVTTASSDVAPRAVERLTPAADAGHASSR